MTEENPLTSKPFVILRRHYRTLPSSYYHFTDPQNPRKSICGIIPGVAYVYVDELPDELRPCGECQALAERRARPLQP